MIKGEKINLRPVTQEDLPTLESWVNNYEFKGEYNWDGLHAVDSFARYFDEDGLIGADGGVLLVVTPDGEIAGRVSYHREGAPATAYYNIGITLAPAFRGKGYGSEAQKLLTAYLFATYSIERVEALTEIPNIAEQKALEKAGFTREGILRRSNWRGGQWRDMVIYSKLRGE